MYSTQDNQPVRIPVDKDNKKQASRLCLTGWCRTSQAQRTRCRVSKACNCYNLEHLSFFHLFAPLLTCLVCERGEEGRTPALATPLSKPFPV
jgi:hypothetical protein